MRSRERERERERVSEGRYRDIAREGDRKRLTWEIREKERGDRDIAREEDREKREEKERRERGIKTRVRRERVGR